MKQLLVLLCGLIAATSSPAATLDLQLVDAGGTPVSDAVVTVATGRSIPAGFQFPGGSTMRQQNIMFVPHTLIVPVGATVGFPNFDRVRHHVYSFSKPARFELKLFGRDQTRSFRFTSSRAVAIGCNIHDRMSGYIKVVDTPFAGLSGNDGRIRIAGLPEAPVKVIVWHPQLRAGGNELAVQLAPNGAAHRIVLDLRR